MEKIVKTYDDNVVKAIGEANITLDEEIENLSKQIELLQARKFELQQEKLNSADTFKEKFFAWLDIEDDDSYQDSVLDEEDFPLLTEHLEDWEFNRYEIIDVIHHLNSYIEDLRDSESEEMKQVLQDNPNYFDILKEVMDGNIKSFKHDW